MRKGGISRLEAYDCALVPQMRALRISDANSAHSRSGRHLVVAESGSMLDGPEKQKKKKHNNIALTDIILH